MSTWEDIANEVVPLTAPAGLATGPARGREGRRGNLGAAFRVSRYLTCPEIDYSASCDEAWGGEERQFGEGAYYHIDRDLLSFDTLAGDLNARLEAALADLTLKFDGVRPAALAVSAQEFAQADGALSSAQHSALETAIETVRKFHAAQVPAALRLETAPGVTCERISVPLRAVGLYVPAGSAPLPSTAIMLAVPAAIAGCRSCSARGRARHSWNSPGRPLRAPKK